ncbi:hypothetical protein [Caldimonas brevitalea]|uniref:hypothetical protein n=1 Tax=Caldimonas brevitalea TaxID=413882 RepID=UPI0012FB74E0|nr:hypothetical protein [Caldimonas brevitalea]
MTSITPYEQEDVSPDPKLSPQLTKALRSLTWEALSTGFNRSLKVGGVVGTLQVFIYYLSLRYNPIDSLEGLGAAAMLVAGISFLVGMSLFCIWGFPVIWFNALVAQRGAERTHDWFGARAAAPASPSDDPSADRGKVLVFVIATFAFPWLAVLAAALPDYFFGQVYQRHVASGFAAAALIYAAPYLFDCWNTIQSSSQGPSYFWPQVFFPRLLVVIVTCVVGAFPLLAFLTVASLPSDGLVESELDFSMTIAAGIFAVVASNAVNVYLSLSTGRTDQTFHFAKWTLQAGVALVAFLFMIFLMGRVSSLQNQVMSLASVRLSPARVVLDETGCKALRYLGASDAAMVRASTPHFSSPSPGAASDGQASEPAPDKEDQPCTLRGVTVGSRLGSAWRFNCNAFEAQAAELRGAAGRYGFVLQAENVLGWSVESKHAPPSEKGADPVRDICKAIRGDLASSARRDEEAYEAGGADGKAGAPSRRRYLSSWSIEIGQT